MERWEHHKDLNGTRLAQICSKLMGISPDKDPKGVWIGSSVPLLIDPPIFWNQSTTSKQFLTDVYYRIDCPGIDVHLRHEVSGLASIAAPYC